MRKNDTGLPAHGELKLSASEAQHTRRVQSYLAAEIVAAGGWLSFERFMDLALYAPGLGYYSAGAFKLGRGGDFTTAPEISSLFGGCVARQCAEVLSAVAAGSILEIGAGSGKMALDILGRLESLGRLPARYWILEVSADLRDRQRRLLQHRLPHLLERVVWLDAPPMDSFDGVILANEVLDALPVVRFRRRGTQFEELGVALDDGAFVWASQPASETMAEICGRLAAAAAGEWDDGYSSEYCPRLSAWTRSVTRPLGAGAVLWFDYGLPRSQYYFPERRDGTLMCHFRQHAHGDPLLLAGLQDITAWVDFTLLAEASREARYRLAGFATQAYFLAGAGIDSEMQAGAGGDENQFARLANQARQLMLPGEMGERFKAMAWVREIDIELSGFSLQDLRHTL